MKTLITRWYFILYGIPVVVVYRASLLGYYPDFAVYYNSVKTVFSGGNPYILIPHNITPFIYPPIDLLLFTPLSVLPLEISSKIWLLVSAGALLLSLLLLFKLLAVRINSLTASIIVALSFLSFPTRFTFGMGQINTIILLILVLGIHFYIQKNKRLSGILFGLNISLKLFSPLFLLYFLIKKDWKVITIFLGAILLAALIPLLVIPHNVLFTFYSNTLPSLLSSTKADYYNQSLNGFLLRQIAENNTENALKFIITGILVVTSFWTLIRKHSQKALPLLLDFGLLTTLSLLINPFSWQHHFVLLVVAFVPTFVYLKKHKKTKSLIFLFISYILISINLPNPNLYPVLVQSHVLYGALLLWGIILYSKYTYDL